MSSKETKIRVRNAFNAMKAIGFDVEKVRPVLKSLLKLYEKNWELIEEENYRVLADALFENEEAEATEETPRPLKRLRSKYQDGQGCSAAAPNSTVPRVPLLVPKDEPCELPESCGPPLNASQTIVVAEKNVGKQPTLDPSPLTDNVQLAITQIVVTMRCLIEQFDNQTKLLSDAKKEALKAQHIADAKDKALVAAEDRAKRAEDTARASMAAEKNALLQLHNSNVALTKMEKEKSAVEEQLKQVREVLEQAHKLATGL